MRPEESVKATSATSKKTGLRAVLTAALCLMVILCSAGCDSRTEPPAQSPRTFEGNISPFASFSASGLASDAELSLLNDGVKSVPCVLTPKAGAAAELIADMGAVYRVCRLDVYPGTDGEFIGRAFPRYFEVHLSADGKNYKKTAVYNNVDSPDCVPVLEFSPVNARYVKIIISGFAPAENGTASVTAEIAEIEIISFFGEYAYPE